MHPSVLETGPVQRSTGAAQHTGRVENNSTESRLRLRNPTTPGDASTKTPNVLLLLPRLRGLGRQMRTEGRRAEPRGGPSAPPHRRRAPAELSVPATRHPLFPSSLHCHHNATQARLLLLPREQFFCFWTRQNAASCQVKSGHSLLVSAGRI